MKALYLFILLLIVGCDNVEDENDYPVILAQPGLDTLAKYSYKLSRISKSNVVGSATGFFIKQKAKLYLVSNYHVFTGRNTFSGAPDTSSFNQLWLPIMRHGGWDIQKIDVTDIRKNSKPRLVFEQSDIYVYELKVDPAYINSVEAFSYSPFPNQQPDSIIIYGYSEARSKTPTLLLSTIYKDSYFKPLTIHKQDSTSIVFETAFFTTPSSINGYSGSPVFFKYNYNNSIVFAGILSSHMGLSNKAVVTLIFKSPEVYKAINAYK